MNKDNIEKFIYYGLNINQGKKEIRNLSIGINFIFVIGFIYGIILGGISKNIGIVMLLISLISITSTFVFSHRLTIRKRIVINSIFSTNMVLNTLLFEIIIYGMLYGMNLYVLLLLIPPIFSIFVYFLIIKKELKKETFNFKSVNKSRIKISSLLGGITGLAIARVFLSNIQQQAALMVVLLGLMFITIIFAFGLINYVKLYYLCRE